MKNILIMACLWNILAFCSDLDDPEDRKVTIYQGRTGHADLNIELVRARLRNKLANKVDTYNKALADLNKVDEFYEKDPEEARRRSLVLLNAHEKSSDKKTRKIAGKAAYNIAQIALNKTHKIAPDLLNKYWEIEIIPFWERAARLGNINAIAKLALNQKSPECDDDYIDNQQLKSQLESSLKVEKLHIKTRIEMVLAYDFYIKIEKERKSADEIFSRLIEEPINKLKFTGLMGKLMLAKATGDQSKIISAYGLVSTFFLENMEGEDLSMIAPNVVYDFTVAVNELQNDQPSKEWAKDMLTLLKNNNYSPAAYYLLENFENALKTETAVEISAATLTVARESEEKGLSSKTELPLEPAQTVTAAPVQTPKKATKAKQKPKKKISLSNTPFVFLSTFALDDIDTIVSKNNGLPKELSGISELGERIVQNQGDCRSKLAKKIMGTKGFWRSHLGRDYRMDWQYGKNEDGSSRIEIRHIGLKRNFTYRQ